MADPVSGAAEKKEDFGDGDKGLVTRWIAEITGYEKKFAEWEKEAKKIRDRYRSEKDDKPAESQSFNILWSNVRTLQPALFSRVPEPNVTRRFRDKDPAGRSAAMIMERSLSYCVDDYEFDNEIRDTVDDYLLAARGQAWVRYVPTYDSEEKQDRIPVQRVEDGYSDEDGVEYDTADEDDEGLFALSEPYKPVLDEEVVCEYVNWADFGHVVAPRWTLVPAVWRKVMLDRDGLIEAFGKEIGSKIPLDAVTGLDKKEAEKHGDVFKRALVYEIWDKPSRKVVWISKAYPDSPLKVESDPLGLDGFFPCPRPLYDTVTGDSLVPVPEFREYADQADQIDELTERMDLILSSVRVAGVYDATVEGLKALVQDGMENLLLPVSNWAAFAEKGGLQGAVSFLPMDEIVSVLSTLYEAREKAKQDLYEITGLSDIIRGASDPGETATAQGIKGRYAGMRLESRQDNVARFVRDIYRIKAEIIAEKFSAEKIRLMSDFDGTLEAESDATSFEQALAVLREDGVRSYRLDFETDATVSVDQDAEKKMRMEFLNAVTPFIEKGVVASQAMPGIAPVLSEMLMFVMRGFKTGRDVESTIEEALQAAGKAAAEKADNQGPTPEQMKHEADMQKAQAEVQKAGIEAQEAQAAAIQAGQKHQLEMAKLHDDAVKRAQEHEQAMAALQTKLADALNKGMEKDADGARKDRELDLKEREFDRKALAEESKDIAAMDALGERAATDKAWAQTAETLTGLANNIAMVNEAAENQAQERHEQLMTAITAPKTVAIERDEDGKMAGAVMGVS